MGNLNDQIKPPPTRSFLRDDAGLSTMEYSVLFVVLLIGGLALWTAVGQDVVHNTAQGYNTLGSTLSEYVGPEHQDFESSPGEFTPPSSQTNPSPPPTSGAQPRRKRKITQ